MWGIGDCAANVDTEGNAIPPNAQAAVQGGSAVAKNVLAAIDGEELKPFNYKSVGQLVEMGSQFAVNEVMGVKFSGFLAALFWRATYLFKTESPQNKARIAADWDSGALLPPDRHPDPGQELGDLAGGRQSDGRVRVAANKGERERNPGYRGGLCRR